MHKKLKRIKRVKFAIYQINFMISSKYVTLKRLLQIKQDKNKAYLKDDVIIGNICNKGQLTKIFKKILTKIPHNLK